MFSLFASFGKKWCFNCIITVTKIYVLIIKKIHRLILTNKFIKCTVAFKKKKKRLNLFLLPTIFSWLQATVGQNQTFYYRTSCVFILQFVLLKSKFHSTSGTEFLFFVLYGFLNAKILIVNSWWWKLENIIVTLMDYYMEYFFFLQA